MATIDAGLDRIERIFAADEEGAARPSSPAPRPPTCIQTHGFPPELFETMAAERNLAFDWEGFREEMERHGIESGGGQKVELFQPRPAGRPEKGHARQPFPRLRTLEVADARVIGIIADEQLCDKIDEVDHEQPIVGRARQNSLLRRDGRAGGRHGRNRRRRLPLRGDRHAVDGGFTLHRGHLRAGRIELGPHVTARVDAERAGRASAAPIRPRTCCTTPCKSTWASTPCSKARRSTTTCCGSTSPTRRPSARRS